MTTQISSGAVLSNGVEVDASILDDRNYVEVDDAWLARAAETLCRQQDSLPRTALRARTNELTA